MLIGIDFFANNYPYCFKELNKYVDSEGNPIVPGLVVARGNEQLVSAERFCNICLTFVRITVELDLEVNKIYKYHIKSKLSNKDFTDLFEFTDKEHATTVAYMNALEALNEHFEQIEIRMVEEGVKWNQEGIAMI